MYLKIIFIICAVVFFSLMCLYKLFISRQERTEKTAIFVSFMGASLLLYVISGFLFGIFAPTIINKFVIVLFALSPFIIGKFATYEKENYYAFLQIFCILLSTIYTFIV